VTRDYGNLVTASAGAALLAVAVKLSAVVTIANLHGASLRPRVALGWLPYVEVLADRTTFTQIVTLSTAAMAAAAALRLLPAALRGGADPDLVSGRVVGVAVAAETLGLEYVRHLVDGPLLAWPAAAVVLGLLAAGTAAGVAAAARAGDGDPTVPAATRAGARGVRRPGRRRASPVVPTAMVSLPADPFAWDRDEAEIEEDDILGAAVRD
jgi:hypothetical protein